MQSLSVDLLPGFKLFTDEPTLMLQLIAALLAIDYVCYMANSDIQAAYADSKAVQGEGAGKYTF